MTPTSGCRVAAVATVALLMASCSDIPTPITDKIVEPAAVPAKTDSAQPVTAKTAYWEMYKMARTWASDITPLSLKSRSVPGIRNEAGKAAMWTAAFASPSKREVRSFSYAVAAAEGIVKGVEADRAMAWGGPSRDAMPFRMADVGVDSDTAFQTAAEKGKDWLKAHPKEEYSITLGHASRFPAPVWYIIWGNNKSGFNAWVNATTGRISLDGR